MLKILLKSAAILAAAAALLAPPNAEARTLDEIMSAKKIRVGINPTLPPLGLFNDKKEIDGFDADIAKKIAEMLGVELEIVQVGSPDRIPFVSTGKIDFVMGAITRTPERAKVIDYTVPLHTELFGVLTIQGKPYKHWKDLDDPNVRMIQVRGTTPVPYIQKNLPKAQVTLLDNYPDVIRALAQGRGDAMLDVVDFVGGHMNKYPDVKWKVLESPVDVYFVPVGVAKGNYSLRDWLNIAIFELQRSGFVKDTWKKWFGIDMLYDVGTTPYF